MMLDDSLLLVLLQKAFSRFVVTEHMCLSAEEKDASVVVVITRVVVVCLFVSINSVLLYKKKD